MKEESDYIEINNLEFKEYETIISFRVGNVKGCTLCVIGHYFDKEEKIKERIKKELGITLKNEDDGSVHCSKLCRELDDTYEYIRREDIEKETLSEQLEDAKRIIRESNILPTKEEIDDMVAEATSIYIPDCYDENIKRYLKY